jgi:imidazole glycerol-phosphate synthase subunit HisH
MNGKVRPNVVIINHDMGNLFSVQRACEVSGVNGIISSDFRDLDSADAVIIPGVGAFNVAMDRLKSLDLVVPLKEFAQTGKPMVGICLGFQLMMEESYEFGHKVGLSLFKGDVRHLGRPVKNGKNYKVPHIGWSRIEAPFSVNEPGNRVSWENSFLQLTKRGEYMYFVHSYYVNATERTAVLGETTYGDGTFCSAMQKGNLFGCQFHPERSGKKGLMIYKKLLNTIETSK